MIDQRLDSDHYHVYQMRNPSDKYKFERDIKIHGMMKHFRKRKHLAECYQVKQLKKLLKRKEKDKKPITFGGKCNP